MVRGTTPTHYFTLPFDTGQLERLRITYAQNGLTVLELTEENVALAGKEIRYQLTQEDTLRFKNNVLAEVQVRVKTTDGNVLASNVMAISVGKILNEDVL